MKNTYKEWMQDYRTKLIDEFIEKTEQAFNDYCKERYSLFLDELKTQNQLMRDRT